MDGKVYQTLSALIGRPKTSGKALCNVVSVQICMYHLFDSDVCNTKLCACTYNIGFHYKFLQN